MNRTLIFALLLVLVGGRAQAQSKTGTTIGQVLLIEPSARLAAMGNAGAVASTEAMAAYYNPGALGFLPASQAQFTHSPWLADINYDYATVAIQNGASTLLLSVTSLNSGEIEVTEARPSGQTEFTGRRYTVQDLVFGMGYGRRFTDRFSAGLQAKVLRETIDKSSLSAFALDFGVIYMLPFNAVLGASISNFGSRGRYQGLDLRVGVDDDSEVFGDPSNRDASLETETYPLPIYFRVGLGLPVKIGFDQQVLLAVDAFQPSDNTNSVSFGAEWAFRDILKLRSGYQNLFLEDAEGGLTFGGGLQYEVSGFGLTIDYAWNDFGARLGETQRFTFGLSF